MSLECYPCSRGNTSAGAAGVPGTTAWFHVALGCTRALHISSYPVCGRHMEWLKSEYTRLVCPNCSAEGVLCMIDGMEAEVIIMDGEDADTRV